MWQGFERLDSPTLTLVISFLVVGLAVGVLARALRSGPGRPQVMVTLPVAVAASLAGGVATNWLRGLPLADAPFLSLCVALAVCLIAVIGLEATHPPQR